MKANIMDVPEQEMREKIKTVHITAGSFICYVHLITCSYMCNHLKMSSHPTLSSMLQIEDVSSPSQLQELLDTDELDFRYDLGISIPAHKVRLDDREKIVSSIALHYRVLVVKAELDQILCGLSSTLNALTLIRDNAAVMRPLFVYQQRPPPTADTLFDMLQAKFSESGTNAREVEEATMMIWCDFLQMVDGKNYNYVGS